MTSSGDLIHFPRVLIESASKGDELAFKEIYSKLSGKMYTICLRYAGRMNDANDLFQEGFIKLYRNLGNFRHEGSFEGWARKIFVNICLDAMKKKNIIYSEIEKEQEPAASISSGFDSLTVDDLMNKIRKLPDGYRTIMNLYVIEGYSHAEIAAMLGITAGSSKSQLFKARGYLKKLIEKEDLQQNENYS
ncbi:MAG: sigma-70 family RNA polymerase sigma factor [Chitinophagaceae bacterium]